MLKHPGSLNRLHSKLLARYGVDDALVMQFKTEIDLQNNQNVMDGRWLIPYDQFIKGAFQSGPQIALHA